jgi:CheY-like chemotaxis protein
MAVIALVAKDDKTRGELRLALEELGHRAAPACDLKGGLELLNTERPRLMLVAQDPAEDVAEAMLFELEREAPLLPVVVALTRRSAPRALELLKAGAYEVVAPPWGAEALRGSLAKALRFHGTSFEQPRPAGPAEAARAAGAWLLAALLLLAGAGGLRVLYLHRRRAAEAARPAPATQWALPYGHPAGLAYDGRELWVSDWFSAVLYRHTPGDKRVAATVPLPGEVPGALAFAGGALYVASGPRAIVKHMLDGRFASLGRFQDAAPQTVGMAYDGLYLWTCDAAKGRLHKRVLDGELSVAASYDYPGKKPAALAFDGKRLWSLDAGERELLRHDLDDPRRVTLRLPLPEYDSGGWTPVGLAFDGRRFLSAAVKRAGGLSEGRLFAHELPPEVLAGILKP